MMYSRPSMTFLFNSGVILKMCMKEMKTLIVLNILAKQFYIILYRVGQ